MPNPNTAAQADLPNPITAALTDVLVGLETSFNRLSVVPLIAGVPPRAPSYVTLDEALAGGNFEVTEISDAGRVPELHVLNRSNRPVLMLDGEELVGAKQNRIVNLTILVPAKTNLPIPVTCVEAGRWRHRSRDFSSSGHAHYAHARARKVAQVSAIARSNGGGPKRPAMDMGRHCREGRTAGGELGHVCDVEPVRCTPAVHRRVRHGFWPGRRASAGRSFCSTASPWGSTSSRAMSCCAS